jgi:hypothetical protein
MTGFVNPKKVCVLSGRFPRSEFLYSWNHYAYAERHGYTYISCDWPTGVTNRYMTKFAYLRHYLPHFDYVFWIDDDAFFVDLEKPLDRFIPEENQLASFCRSPTNKSIFTYLSSGQFLIKSGRDSEDFIEAILDVSLDKVKDWWRDDLGMFTNGDQDAIVYLIHNDERFVDCVKLFDYMSFNSRIADLDHAPDDVFLLHFTGPRSKKIADALVAMKILKSGPSLLPKPEEKRLLGRRSLQDILRVMNAEIWMAKKKEKKKKPMQMLRRLLKLGQRT